MKWFESEGQPGSCTMELTQWEAEILVRSVVDYNLDRLRDGKGLLKGHVILLDAVTGNDKARLSGYGPHDFPKLTEPLLNFASNTEREADKLLGNHQVYAELELGVARRSDGIKARMLYQEMTDAKYALIEADEVDY